VTDKVCWRVTATDTLSMPGVLEITAIEYYANESEDSDGLVGNLVVNPVEPELNKNLIVGEGFIRPKKVYQFNYEGIEEGEWKIESATPLEYTISGKVIEVKWPKTYSGQFTLSFGDTSRTIIVESLF
jgi:hypothetical protein